jgi:hypothetical protein
MATGKLTAIAVEHAHREGQPVMLCDGGGLYFRKQTRDGASWTLRYRFAGRARWMTLGNYPDMSLADARIVAREKRTMLDKQRDPLLEKQAFVEQQRAAIVAQKARGTFREIAEDWYDTEIEGQRLKHPQVPRRHLDNYLLPEFGDRVPAEITPADAARLLARSASVLRLPPMISCDSCGVFSGSAFAAICCHLTQSQTSIRRTRADRSESADVR